MINSVGAPQSLLLLGGTSDIAQAIARNFLHRETMRVILAARPSTDRDAAAESLRLMGARVQVLDFDALDFANHQRMIEKASAEGDIDIAVVAFAQLGDQTQLAADPLAAASLAQINYVAAVSTGTALASVMRRQRHGQIIALSSVAAQRPRASNVVYGSSKAGFDAFFIGLSLSLEGAGVKVLVVRPGFVLSKMTAGLAATPMSSTPDEVAQVVTAAIWKRKNIVWSPHRIRWLMGLLNHLPRPVFRRLPL